MRFDPSTYGDGTAAILALGGSGVRPMPLTFDGSCSPKALNRLSVARAELLFPNRRSPRGALSGLWLYFSCFDESHEIAQELHTPEGSFWHAIVHRREPDPGNSGYWFRRVGSHAIFPSLRDAAAAILESRKAGFRLGSVWDPFAFIDYCEDARRRPGSEEERIAMEIQLAEWQHLFDYCARPAE